MSKLKRINQAVVNADKKAYDARMNQLRLQKESDDRIKALEDKINKLIEIVGELND